MRRGRSRIGISTVVDSADTKLYTVHKSGGAPVMNCNGYHKHCLLLVRRQ